ncbi:O-antigen ligase family protein [Candidatus Thioglobus sp.]|nr:O-antigen ligase family protein [Candidatus Thioglobus sp.]
MIDHPLNRRYSQVVNVLIFIFPIVINSLQVAGDIVLFILAMMGIFIAISKKISPFNIKEIKVFSYLTIGYFMAVCLSVIFSGQAAELAHFIPRDFYFLFAPFIALALYKAEINRNYLIVGAKVSLLVIGGIIIYFGGERNTGVMNAGVFGNLAVLLFFIVLAFSFSQHESLKHKVFSFIALLFGLVAIVGSGTRGAWLSFLLLLGIYIFFLYKQKNKLSKKSKIIVVFVIATLITFGSFNDSLKDRSQIAYTEINSWISGNRAPTSVGLRLEMYRLAFEKIEDVPFFGHGYRTSNVVVFENSTTPGGRLSYTFNHLHNTYLTQYFNGGFVLLAALLLLLFVPLIIFLKANSQDRENPIFISGVLLTIGYTSIGMVNILFGDTYMNGFYTFFLAIFMLLSTKTKKISTT